MAMRGANEVWKYAVSCISHRLVRSGLFCHPRQARAGTDSPMPPSRVGQQSALSLPERDATALISVLSRPKSCPGVHRDAMSEIWGWVRHTCLSSRVAAARPRPDAAPVTMAVTLLASMLAPGVWAPCWKVSRCLFETVCRRWHTESHNLHEIQSLMHDFRQEGFSRPHALVRRTVFIHRQAQGLGPWRLSCIMRLKHLYHTCKQASSHGPISHPAHPG